MAEHDKEPADYVTASMTVVQEYGDAEQADDSQLDSPPRQMRPWCC